MFSATRRVELPLTEVQKAADKADFGLEIDQEFVFGPIFEVPVTHSNGDIEYTVGYCVRGPQSHLQVH